jgi:pyroglutamyl-peptidase
MSASTKVLITAFEPYDRWEQNASWLAVQELTRDMPTAPKITTRLYPVDFGRVRERLECDLAKNYDVVLHLGQSPGLGRIHLESIALNIGGSSRRRPDECQPLVPHGPVAYRSELPLADWAASIRSAGIPAQVSYHAGTFLCNATMYLTHHWSAKNGSGTRAGFVHLPLASCQVTAERDDIASLPVEQSAQAVRIMLDAIAAW